jgi:hypothetical protein
MHDIAVRIGNAGGEYTTEWQFNGRTYRQQRTIRHPFR